MLGGMGGRRKRGQQRVRLLDGLIGSMDMSLSKLCEILNERETWCATVYRVEKSKTWLSD